MLSKKRDAATSQEADSTERRRSAKGLAELRKQRLDRKGTFRTDFLLVAAREHLVASGIQVSLVEDAEVRGFRLLPDAKGPFLARLATRLEGSTECHTPWGRWT